MDAIWEGLREAIRLIASGDAQLREIALRTVLVSGGATLLAMAVGVPLGYGLARTRFPGRTLILGAVNTGMGVPPVVVGLVVWLMLVRSGPFGPMELIYTKRAMVIAQFVIATPLVVGFTAAAIQALPREFPDLLTVLRAGPLTRFWLTVREAQLGIMVAVMAGFGAVVSEVGASMTVGGNINGQTRVITTAIVTETARGETAGAMALGIILLAITFAVTLLLTALQQRRAR
ncbi:MAG: ABC transporter permease [Dehalococcoidia bacterium]|nr:ABC transporter permease [Dehalococcoidia bacterium]